TLAGECQDGHGCGRPRLAMVHEWPGAAATLWQSEESLRRVSGTVPSVSGDHHAPDDSGNLYFADRAGQRIRGMVLRCRDPARDAEGGGLAPRTTASIELSLPLAGITPAKDTKKYTWHLLLTVAGSARVIADSSTSFKLVP